MSVNQVWLQGHLGNDPVAENGRTRFSLATNESYKDRDGNWQTTVSWHNVVAFGGKGEAMAKYLKKGEQVSIIGQIEYFKKEEVTYTNIKVKDFAFISNKSETKPKEDFAF